MKLAVLGAGGRVGKLVVDAAATASDIELVAQIGRSNLGAGCFVDADVVIDFSLPEALAAALPHLGAAALVSGTTGLDAGLTERLRARSQAHPVLRADNFSTGVTLLGELVATAARALPDYDIEVVEAHHRHKLDAPSGTALYLAERAAQARGHALADRARHGREGRTGQRPAGQIGMHALRGGDVVGDHTVWLLGDGDRVQLGHVATSRQTFATGSLRAARWLHGQGAGWYGMTDVLGL